MTTLSLKIKKTLFSLFLFTFINACFFQASAQEQLAPLYEHTAQLSEPRYGHTTVKVEGVTFVIGGADLTKYHSTIEVIGNKTLETHILNLNIIPRRYGAAAWDGKESIYIFGGQTLRPNDARKVEVINLRTLEVSAAPSMPVNCHSITAARIKGDIYISGGSCAVNKNRRAKPSSKVHKYSIAKRTWSLASPLKHRVETKTIALNNQLYMIAGYTGKGSITEVMRFNPQSNEWTQLPPIPLKTSAHSLVAVNNKIYVLGDYNDMGRSFAFDTDSQQWQKLDLSFNPVRHASAVYGHGKILLVGGYTGDSQAHNYIQTINL
jgi:hypothetical protein